MDHDPQSEIITEDDALGFSLPVLKRMDALRGDLRDGLADRFKAQPKPWTIMSEAEQRDALEGFDRSAYHLVTQACRIISSNGHPAIPCTIKKAAVGDKFMVTVEVSPHDPLRHQLYDALASSAQAMLVLSSPDAYMGETAPAKPDPDEPPLFDLTDAGKGEETVVVPMKRARGRPPLSEAEKAQRAAQREADRRAAAGTPISSAFSAAVSAAANVVQQTPLGPATFSQTYSTMQETTQSNPKSIEEFLTVRHPNGATPAMIIADGFRMADITDLVKQRKVEMIDGYYVWLEPDAVPPEAGE